MDRHKQRQKCANSGRPKPHSCTHIQTGPHTRSGGSDHSLSTTTPRRPKSINHTSTKLKRLCNPSCKSALTAADPDQRHQWFLMRATGTTKRQQEHTRHQCQQRHRCCRGHQNRNECRYQRRHQQRHYSNAGVTSRVPAAAVTAHPSHTLVHSLHHGARPSHHLPLLRPRGCCGCCCTALLRCYRRRLSQQRCPRETVCANDAR